MPSVTLYLITRTKTYQMSEQGSGYSLEPWGNNTDYYEGHDDGGKDYVLPEGYTVCMTKDGERAIFNAADGHCSIVRHSSGLPQLISLSNNAPVLRSVA